MLLKTFLTMFIALHAFPAVAYDSVFSCNGKEKFNWYCKEEKKLEEKKPTIPLAPPATPSVASELLEHQEIQKTLEELLKIAYVNPTDENIKNYIAYQNMVTEKAAYFADKWKRTLWKNPSLDYRQKFPVAKMAKQTNLQMLALEENAMYDQLNKDGYGLFFFYKTDCPYCIQMEQPLKYFKSTTKMDVLPISIDGRLLNDKFPGSIADSGQAAALNVTNTPMIFLVNPTTKNITNIATGWVSVKDLKKRIFQLTTKKTGESY